jgi:tetratricopeptide (TPR) repeat protein
MRSFGLEKVRADGWLDQLGHGSQGFDQLCEVVGRSFVAFSVIAGVRITALTIDPRDSNASVVEFEVGGSGTGQRLDLGEFRQRLAEALTTEDEVPSTSLPTDRVASEDIQGFLGYRWVLLAPIFDVRLDELRVDDDDPTEAEIVARMDGERVTLTLDELRDELRHRVQAEAEKHRGPASPFAIDLNLVPQAREAAASGDHARVADILGSWPGPLSHLLRTAEGQALTPEVRATVAGALGMLGTAYVQTGRHEWAQEVLRLGIQWGQDQLEVAADLFSRLGAAYVAQGRHGEAIGPLRRALGLGARRTEVLPQLARCFIARERYVAALLCADDAVASGASADSVRSVRDVASKVLGDDWTRFRRRVPASSATR